MATKSSFGTERQCVECGRDISELQYSAVRCGACARARRNARKNLLRDELLAARRATNTCAECGISISDRPLFASFCTSCVAKRRKAQQSSWQKLFRVRDQSTERVRTQKREWARKHPRVILPKVLPCPVIGCTNTFVKTRGQKVCAEDQRLNTAYLQTVSARRKVA